LTITFTFAWDLVTKSASGKPLSDPVTYRLYRTSGTSPKSLDAPSWAESLTEALVTPVLTWQGDTPSGFDTVEVASGVSYSYRACAVVKNSEGEHSDPVVVALNDYLPAKPVNFFVSIPTIHLS